jgi:hypothetical protein
MDTIRIDSLTGSAGGSWYEEYRRLRHRVFVVEQGWAGLSLPTTDATIPDPADAAALFWLARSPGGALVGAVRVRAVRDVFPHEDLFRRHLARPEMVAMRPWMGTLNSLVVDGAWRRRTCADGCGLGRTVANLLLRASVRDSACAGLRALVATAQTLVSARALTGAGFRVIDPPVLTDLHPHFPMCNVGIVLTPDAAPERSLSAYFDDCERRVLATSSLEAWFREPVTGGTGGIDPDHGRRPPH